MPAFLAPPLPPGCPWSGWTPPNVDWCEEELCSLVVNPAGTWSNLAYVVLGVLMILAARRIPKPQRAPSLDLFGPASILVGLSSLVYHASYTYFFQFFDFVGMFLFCFTVITANALRLGWIGPERRIAFLTGSVVGASALVPLVGETSFPIQGLVGLLIAAILGQEALLWRRAPRAAPYALFGLALALLAAAAAASLADVTRAWCDPANHWLQGHALWHGLSAASLLALFAFYRRLGESRDRIPPPVTTCH
jgi:hypothetical protein